MLLVLWGGPFSEVLLMKQFLMSFKPGTVCNHNLLDILWFSPLVVLFRRDFRLMRPLGALVCVVQQLLYGQMYDHCGVIIHGRDGIPYLLETTFSGTKVGLPFWLKKENTSTWFSFAHMNRESHIPVPQISSFGHCYVRWEIMNVSCILNPLKRRQDIVELAQHYAEAKCQISRSWDVSELLEPLSPSAGHEIVTPMIGSLFCTQKLYLKYTVRCSFFLSTTELRLQM
jgi:hypothetical protein